MGRASARGWRDGGTSLFPKASRLAKGAKRWEGKGFSVERKGRTQCFSSTEGWPVGFGKLPEGGREGHSEKSGGP